MVPERQRRSPNAKELEHTRRDHPFEAGVRIPRAPALLYSKAYTAYRVRGRILLPSGTYSVLKSRKKAVERVERVHGLSGR